MGGTKLPKSGQIESLPNRSSKKYMKSVLAQKNITKATYQTPYHARFRPDFRHVPHANNSSHADIRSASIAGSVPRFAYMHETVSYFLLPTPQEQIQIDPFIQSYPCFDGSSSSAILGTSPPKAVSDFSNVRDNSLQYYNSHSSLQHNFIPQYLTPGIYPSSSHLTPHHVFPASRTPYVYQSQHMAPYIIVQPGGPEIGYQRSPEMGYSRSSEGRYSGGSEVGHSQGPEGGYPGGPEERYSGGPEVDHPQTPIGGYAVGPEGRYSGGPEVDHPQTPIGGYAVGPEGRYSGGPEVGHPQTPIGGYAVGPEGRYSGGPEVGHPQTPIGGYALGPEGRYSGGPERRYSGGPEVGHSQGPEGGYSVGLEVGNSGGPEVGYSGGLEVTYTGDLIVGHIRNLDGQYPGGPGCGYLAGPEGEYSQRLEAAYPRGPEAGYPSSSGTVYHSNNLKTNGFDSELNGEVYREIISSHLTYPHVQHQNVQDNYGPSSYSRNTCTSRCHPHRYNNNPRHLSKSVRPVDRGIIEAAHSFVNSFCPWLGDRLYCFPPVKRSRHPDKSIKQLAVAMESEKRVLGSFEQFFTEHRIPVFMLCHYPMSGFMQAYKQNTSSPDRGSITLCTKHGRGTLTLLLLSDVFSVTIVTVSIISGNSDFAYVQRGVQKAAAHIKRCGTIVAEWLSFLGLASEVRQIIAFPNLKKTMMQRIAKEKHFQQNFGSLCTLHVDDLSAPFEEEWSTPIHRRLFSEWMKEMIMCHTPTLLRDELCLVVGALLSPRLSKVDFVQGQNMIHPISESPRDTGSPEAITKDMSQLTLTIDGVTKPFDEFMDDYVTYYYPNVEEVTYRVPPIHFNIQSLRKPDEYLRSTGGGFPARKASLVLEEIRNGTSEIPDNKVSAKDGEVSGDGLRQTNVARNEFMPACCSLNVSAGRNVDCCGQGHQESAVFSEENSLKHDLRKSNVFNPSTNYVEKPLVSQQMIRTPFKNQDISANGVQTPASASVVQLSQNLRARSFVTAPKSSPSFFISSSQSLEPSSNSRKKLLEDLSQQSGSMDNSCLEALQDVEVLCEVMSKDIRADEGENRVVSALEKLGRRFGPMFIICAYQYNNYLNKLREEMFSKGEANRPIRAFGQTMRAEHDCLIVHKTYGAIVVCIKAIGDNFSDWGASEEQKVNSTNKILEKAVKQLVREEAMIRHVTSDLHANLPCHKLIALPNMTRESVEKALDTDKELLKLANPHEESLNELLSADNQVIFYQNGEDLQHNLNYLNSACNEYDMKIDTDKTETLLISREQEQRSFHIIDIGIKQVQEFKYLGSMFADDGRVDREIGHRIQKANSVHYQIAPIMKHPRVLLTARKIKDTLGHGVELFLCSDELPSKFQSMWDKQGHGSWNKLVHWWGQVEQQLRSRTNNMTSKVYRQIIGRYCGLLSTVEIWSPTNPRVEVRNMSEAVSVCAERFCKLVLLPRQLEALCSVDRRVFLYGPPGCGKTLILTLKAREWLQAGETVILINSRPGSLLGYPYAYGVLKRLQQMMIRSKVPKYHLFMIRIDSLRFRAHDLAGIMPSCCIIMDEVSPASHEIIEHLCCLQVKYIWCAGLFEDDRPITAHSFTTHKMDKIIRCPPVIQSIMKHTEQEVKLQTPYRDFYQSSVQATKSTFVPRNDSISSEDNRGFDKENWFAPAIEEKLLNLYTIPERIPGEEVHTFRSQSSAKDSNVFGGGISEDLHSEKADCPGKVNLEEETNMEDLKYDADSVNKRLERKYSKRFKKRDELLERTAASGSKDLPSYCTSSAENGLPTDGPQPYIIDHNSHSQPGSPSDCSECGRQVAEFLSSLVRPEVSTLSQQQGLGKNKHSLKTGLSGAGRIRTTKPGESNLFSTTSPVHTKSLTSSSNQKVSTFFDNRALVWSDVLIVANEMPNECAFVTALKNRDIPVEVMMNGKTFQIEDTKETKLFVTQYKEVTGLERPVIVFVPHLSPDQPQKTANTDALDIHLGQTSNRFTEDDRQVLWHMASRSLGSLVLILP